MVALRQPVLDRPDVSVRAIGQYDDPEQLRDTVVGWTDAGAPVYVADVAEVGIGFKRQVSETALAPSTASPMTLNPSDSRSTRALARNDGWSSTIRTVQSTGSIVVTVRTRSHTAGRTTHRSRSSPH